MGRTRYACNGAVRIAYELRGTPHWRRPWLVLIQGLGFDRSGWGPAAASLQRHFRLVLIDNRGSGQSDSPAGSLSVTGMAGDVVAVLDAAGLRSAHLAGASLGGMVAQEVALTWPERVDGLVLACTTPGWPSAYPMPAESLRLIARTATMPREVVLRRHVENALSAGTMRRQPELAGRLVELQRSRPAAWQAQAGAGARYAGRSRAAGIRSRTLIVQGTADTVVDPRNAMLLAELIPGAELVTFAGLGHLFFWEDPAGFAAAVTSFLLVSRRRRPRAGTPRVPTGRPRAAAHPGSR